MTTMTNTTMNLVLAVLASGSILTFAAAPAEAATATVTVASQELATAAGKASVEKRVMAAAEALCAEGGLDRRNLNEMAGYKLCVATAVRDARGQMAAISAKTQLASR